MIRALVLAVLVVLCTVWFIWWNLRTDHDRKLERTRREVESLQRLIEHLYLIADTASQVQTDLTADTILAQIRATPPYDTDPRFQELN